MSEVRNASILANTAREFLILRHPGWTDEQLLFHPRDAMALCVAVRKKLSIREEDDVILRSLINERKRGRVMPMGLRRRFKNRNPDPN